MGSDPTPIVISKFARAFARKVHVGAMALSLGLAAGTLSIARADEGGVPLWLSGQFASLAAVPGTPGWSWASIYLHEFAAAQAGQTFQRGGLAGGSIVAGLQGVSDVVAFGPAYTFATPVLGGQLSVSLTAIGGRSLGSISATVTGPLGNSISGSRTDSVTSFGDLYPLVSLKWNDGVNNYMVYATGDIPVGDYDPMRLANLGIGHGAIDAGFGYTYFNEQTGIEASAVLGLTYNFINPDTNYQSGIDSHLDFAVSKFLTKQLHLGLVGYAYDQLSCDSGSGDRLGCFESRIAGLGPQIGYLFPIGKMQGYVNLRAYHDFDAVNRPPGWSAWFTFAISPAAPEDAKPAATPMFHK